MILRVLWPCALQDLPDQPCVLLGALLSCSQQSQRITTAAVVSIVPLAHIPPLPALQQLASSSLNTVAVPTADARAQVALLGCWQPLQHDEPIPAPQHNPHGLWLALHGKQRLCQSVVPGTRTWRSQPLWAPHCDLQHSLLPPGTQSVQLLLYSVPAQQPGYSNVQLPLPPPAPQLPWMSRDAGAVSLSAVMHMLQQAHAAFQLQPQQAQQQQPDSQAQAQPQPRTRAQRRLAQQQQQSAAECTSLQEGWSQLASLCASTSSSRPSSWLGESWASLLTHAPSAVARPLQQLHQQHSSRAGAGAAGAGQDPSGGQVLHASTGQQLSAAGAQSGVLLVVVQQVLGLLIALNLLLHRQLVLQAAAAVGSWLQAGLLQPHIDWLSQAHPGGVKLHIELSLLLGTVCDAYLQASASLYRLTWPMLGPAALLGQAAAAAVGGASWGCAAAADVLLVLLWPVVLLYVLAAQLHQLQLRCLAATWRLIRGKQKVRRFSSHHRTHQQHPTTSSTSISPPCPAAANSTASSAASTSSSSEAAAEPSDEVSVEQLIVGVLLFTPLLGLLPTSLAWYLSVVALYGTLHLLRLLLLAVGSWMQLRPLHVLAARARRPQLFPGQLMVLPLTPTSAAGAAAGPCAGNSARQRVSRDGTSSSGSPQSSARLGGADGGGMGMAVAHYSIFYEPLGYWEVLVQSIAQQQGLLWYACQRAGSGSSSSSGSAEGSSSGASWLLAWLKDVAAGRVWGLRMLSTQWRLL